MERLLDPNTFRFQKTHAKGDAFVEHGTYLHFHPKRFYLYRYTRKFYLGKIQQIEDTGDVLDVFPSIDCSAITLVQLTGNRNRGLNE